MARSLIFGALPGYLESLAPDRRALLDRYEVIDLGHKVVGVGSVGLLAWVLLLQGRDSDNILTLQVKQAQLASGKQGAAGIVQLREGRLCLQEKRPGHIRLHQGCMCPSPCN